MYWLVRPISAGVSKLFKTILRPFLSKAALITTKLPKKFWDSIHNPFFSS